MLMVVFNALGFFLSRNDIFLLHDTNKLDVNRWPRTMTSASLSSTSHIACVDVQSLSIVLAIIF